MRAITVFLAVILLEGSVSSSPDLFSYYIGRNVDILSAVPTTDGDAILAGRIFVGGQNYDALLLKVNSSGSVEWKEHLGGKKDERFDAVVALKDSTFVAAGLTSTFVAPQMYVSTDILIVRFDGNGKILWRKTLGASGQDWAASATATSDGGVLILAHTNSFGDPDPFLDTYSDFLIIKLNISGEIQWSLNLAAPGDDYPESSISLKDGSVLLAGYGQGFKLIKLSLDGRILWAKKVNELSIFQAMTLLSDGNVLLSGWENDLSSNTILTKITPSGTVIWAKRLTSNNQPVNITALRADDSGGAFISGATFDDKTLFLRINKQGTVQWKKTFDVGNGEDSREMLKLASGTILFVGGAYDFRWITRTVIAEFTRDGEMNSCYSEVPAIQMKPIKMHTTPFSFLPERNLHFRVTSPKLTLAQPNIPVETICP
jgi:hypothetical protein